MRVNARPTPDQTRWIADGIGAPQRRDGKASLTADLLTPKPLDEATREALVMDLFRRRKVSTGKACELLGLDREGFLRRAAELGIPVYLTTEKEWEADLAALEAWRQQ